MKCKISEIENGPLALECDESVLYKNDVKIEAENPAYLCRCGHSKNKPFCDGSHEEAGFTSKREISEETVQEYKGKEISISYNRSICAGAAECVHGLSTVFKSDRSTDWIYPDNDEKRKIIETIKACPSGALSYSIEGKKSIDKRDRPKISIVKNGPYSVEGVSLETVSYPTNFSTTKYTLCRCGHSNNKPYCDYSHAQKNWSDE